MRRQKDVQRSRVYRWEYELRKRIPDEEAYLPRMVIKLAIKQISEEAGIEQPNVQFRARLKRKAYYSGHDHMVVFPGDLESWATHILVVLHEMAHAICDKRYPNNEGHGGEFMQIFIDLIVKHTDLTEREVYESAYPYKLEIGI